MPIIPAIVGGIAAAGSVAARVAPTVIRAVGAAGRVTGKVADIAQSNNNNKNKNHRRWGDAHSMHLTHDDIVSLTDVPVLDAAPRLQNSDKRKQRRDLVSLCGVPQYNFDMCASQLQQGPKVVSSIPSPGVAKFVKIPPACMNLAVVLSGSCTGEGTAPVPCGSDCMQYTGLNDQQMMFLSKALNGQDP